MRLLSAALCTTVAAALLAACSGNGSSPSSSVMPGSVTKVGQAGHHMVPTMIIPKSMLKDILPFRRHLVPVSYTRGIAASEFTPSGGFAYIYPKNNSANGPPNCTDPGVAINGFASDSAGALVLPDAFSGIAVYAPPFSASSCGTLLATIPDSLGQSDDAAAINAATGDIVVGHNDGIVAICTIAADSCTELSSPGMASGFTQVAMDKNGNCYADGTNGTAISLWVYSGTASAPCTGAGAEATGFSETNEGGIDVDNAGNLTAVALGTPSTVTTYSGCVTGTCTVVSGPTTLTGESVYGHIGRQNERFVTVDVTDESVEVYSYKHATGVGAMLYTFNNGLTCSGDVCEGAAYMPNSQR